MKKFFMIFLMIVGLTGLAFAQLSPSTPIDPVAPTTVAPAPIPVPAPAPVNPLIKSDFWFDASLGVGMPYTGLATLATGYDFMADFTVNLTLGFTPFHLSNNSSIGFSVRASIGLTYLDFGTFDVQVPDGYYWYWGTQSAYAYETWIGVTPMISGKFILDRNSCVKFGIGYGAYHYTSVALITDGDLGYAETDIALNMALSWTFSAFIQFQEGTTTQEFGMIGPDFYVGCGFSL